MSHPSPAMSVARRFLQVRRREPLQDREITALLHPEVRYVEVVDGQQWTLTGADTVVGLLRRFWSGMAMDARMSVIRQWAVDEQTVMGHWRREGGSGIVNGRDTYTVVDGVITEILVEEFPAVTMPDPRVVTPLARV